MQKFSPSFLLFQSSTIYCQELIQVNNLTLEYFKCIKMMCAKIQCGCYFFYFWFPKTGTGSNDWFSLCIEARVFHRSLLPLFAWFYILWDFYRIPCWLPLELFSNQLISIADKTAYQTNWFRFCSVHSVFGSFVLVVSEEQQQ